VEKHRDLNNCSIARRRGPNVLFRPGLMVTGYRWPSCPHEQKGVGPTGRRPKNMAVTFPPMGLSHRRSQPSAADRAAGRAPRVERWGLIANLMTQGDPSPLRFPCDPVCAPLIHLYKTRRGPAPLQINHTTHPRPYLAVGRCIFVFHLRPAIRLLG
jgi:hypothetical protein